MYARMTLLEIDTLRTSVSDAVEKFRAEVVPRLREQPGYLGVYALANPDGKAALLSLWDTAEHAAVEREFYTEELAKFTTFFRSAPGRDHSQVVFAEEPAAAR